MAAHEPTGAAERMRQVVVSVVGHPFTTGNSIEVLVNGDEIFPAMLSAVRNARRSVDLVTFVYWTGDIAREMAGALTERAAAGVSVRVILDGVGCRQMDRGLVERMRAAGARVEWFRPPIRWKFWETDHRTHRKILVCDGEVAFTGGVGIAEEWQGDARDPSEWRDTHFRVEGPVVAGLRGAFLTDWRDLGLPLELTDTARPPSTADGNIEAMTIDGSAQIGFNEAERMLEAVLDAARERILIQTPYFNPTARIIEVLMARMDAGVEVEVMVPGPHIDKRVSRAVASDRLRPLVDGGARIWIYQPTMLHTKAVMVDSVLAVVGSVNLNRRSAEKDEEVALAVLDAEVARRLEGDFAVDRSRSKPIELEDATRVRELAGKLLSPFRSEM